MNSSVYVELGLTTLGAMFSPTTLSFTVLALVLGERPLRTGAWFFLGAFGVTSPSYAAAIRLIESGRLPLAEMHTHDFALADAERAIQTLAGEIPGEQSVHSCLLPAR